VGLIPSIYFHLDPTRAFAHCSCTLGYARYAGTLTPQMHEMERKEHHMFKDIIRMILPLVVLVLIAMCLALSPVMGTHAAAPHGAGIHLMSQHNMVPNAYWRP
jgi:hypothetical protein